MLAAISLPFLGKHQRVKRLGDVDNKITIYFRNENKQIESPKNTISHPRGKWSWDCSIWRVILCYSAANYFLDFTGKTLLV